MANGLFYTLGLNPGNFLSVAGRAAGAVKSIGGAAAGIAGTVMKVTGALTAMAAGVGAFAALQKGLTLAADTEKTEVGLNTIIKNLNVTKGLVADLNKLAKETPLEMPDLTGGARTLLGGGFSLGEVVPLLKMLGDVAAGAQADLGGITMVLNQVKGKGKLYAEELQQLSEQGVAGLREELAKLRGVSVAQVMDDIGEGKLGAEDLIGAFRGMTSAGGIFFKAMEAQSKTAYGLLSTLSDAVNKIYLAFSRPLLDMLKPVLDGAIVKADELAAKAQLIVGSWQVAFQNGSLGELLYDQVRVGLAKAGNLGVALVSGLIAGIKSAGGAFEFVLNPQLWAAAGNLLKLSLMEASAAFAKDMIQRLREVGKSLPRAIRPDDAALGRAAFRAEVDATNAGTARRAQTGQIGAYFDAYGFIQRLDEGISSVPESFMDAWNKAAKPFDETPGQVARDAATAARIKENNALIEQKKAYEAATKGAQSATSAVGGLTKALNLTKEAGTKAMENLTGQGKGGAGVGEGGMGEGGRRRIVSFNAAQSGIRRFMRLSPGARKWYDGTNLKPGTEPLGVDEQFKNFNKDNGMGRDRALDYLKRRGKGSMGFGSLAEFAATQGSRVFGGLPGRRAASEGKDNNSTLQMLLKQIAENTEGLKVK